MLRGLDCSCTEQQTFREGARPGMARQLLPLGNKSGHLVVTRTHSL